MSKRILDALDKAYDFISGFEDDESQEGIEEMLTKIKNAMFETAAQLAKTHRDLPTNIVELYADDNSLNTETHENHKEAAQALLNQYKMKTEESPKVFIELSGGLIRQITANRSDISICVADYDSEDWDDESENIETIEGSAWMRIENQPDAVYDKVYKTFESREKLDTQEKYAYDKLKAINF